MTRSRIRHVFSRRSRVSALFSVIVPVPKYRLLTIQFFTGIFGQSIGTLTVRVYRCGPLYMSSIKLAWQTERLAGLSDHGSNLPCLTTWVGRVLLSPVPYGDLLSLSFEKNCRTLSLSLLLLLFRWCFSILISWCRGWGIHTLVKF